MEGRTVLRRTFLSMMGGLAGIAVERNDNRHITWRVFWNHFKDNEHTVTIYLYGEHEAQPSLIFTNKCGAYRAWQLKGICEEGTISDPKPVDEMPGFVKDELRTMKYGVEVILEIRH